MERGFVFKNLIQQLITLLLLYFLMGIWWGDEQWFKDKIKELSFFLSVAMMFFLASLGTSLISRPVIIQISQENKCFNQPMTTFSITGRKRTQEHEREIDLSINVVKNQSIWGAFVCYLLRKLNISIVVEPVTPGIILEADDEAIRQDLSSTTEGFRIHIDNYIEAIIKRSNNASNHKKTCGFVIQESRVHIVSDEVIQITPILMRGSKIAPFWLNALVRFENPSHKVIFKRG
jgi:hypothetical protein